MMKIIKTDRNGEDVCEDEVASEASHCEGEGGRVEGHCSLVVMVVMVVVVVMVGMVLMKMTRVVMTVITDEGWVRGVVCGTQSLG